ncbi:hypothetical protein HPB52_006008 [Rhipicephalus sanguineus]|uniref:Uncharacterized protein n=1 Tax=Rhipicephalus sanguineus TaxID=34632 RepID=A0A9D4SWH7_RHISA|nr:hypothetical protein HPB52_006008 [Rhipicephalus sanguineus]
MSIGVDDDGGVLHNSHVSHGPAAYDGNKFAEQIWRFFETIADLAELVRSIVRQELQKFRTVSHQPQMAALTDVDREEVRQLVQPLVAPPAEAPLLTDARTDGARIIDDHRGDYFRRYWREYHRCRATDVSTTSSSSRTSTGYSPSTGDSFHHPSDDASRLPHAHCPLRMPPPFLLRLLHLYRPSDFPAPTAPCAYATLFPSYPSTRLL